MNLIEITKKLPTELDCVQFFEKFRWDNGKKKCAYCESENISNRAKDLRHHCMDCRKTFFVTTNTQLHGTKTDLQQWLFAFSVITDAKKGLSALQLKRNISVSYPTAWSMYHKIRDLMSIENDAIELLDNIVELDSKVVDVSNRKCQTEKKGTPNHIPELDEKIDEYKDRFKFEEGEYKKPCKTGKQGTGGSASNKKIAGAVERNGNVVARVIKTTTFEELRVIIDKHVKKSRQKTVLLTNDARANRRFKNIINHISIDHFKMYSYRGLNTNTIESFWAVIERQIVGQHHHVDLKYLDKYVAEAVFKFNNRKVDDMFITLVRKAMLPYVL